MDSKTQTLTYYKKKRGINNLILRSLNDKEVIYGSFALNKQLPPILRDTPGDIDIFSPRYKSRAKLVEKALDKYMGFNAFEVRQAEHEGTVKIKSRITGKTVADYSKRPSKVSSVKFQHHNYASLPYLKQMTEKAIKNPEAKFRREKDKNVYNRISLAENLRRK